MYLSKIFHTIACLLVQFPFAHAPRDLISPGRVDFSTSLGSRPRPSSITNPYSMYFPEPGHRRNAGSPPHGSSLFPGGRPNNVSIPRSSVGRLPDLAAQNPLPRLPDSGQFHPSTYGHGRYSSMDTQSRPQPSMPGRPRGSSMFDLEPRHGMMSPPSSRAPLPTSSRPRLRERDICPVCRRALPPRGENGDETAREGHIMACITARDPSSSAGAEAGSSSRGPVHMVAFTASEKDCVGEEGNVQECSICMVEYDVGDELARLECFCKFHKECIVSWLNRKAECPVHKAARFNV
jgi:Ring finger domain